MKLVEALRERDRAAVQCLLDQSSELISTELAPGEMPEDLGRGREGSRPLHLASFWGGAEILDLLLDRGADTEIRNGEGRTALHVGLEHNMDSARHLVARGCELDIVAAACLAELDRMRELLDHDVALANDASTHLSPLGWACYHGSLEAARLLIESGARIDDGELRCCAGVANVEMAGLLIESGAKVDERWNADGTTALHVAAAHRYTRDASEFVRFLLDAGADRRTRAAKRGPTALELAEDRQREQDRAGIGPGDGDWRNYEAVITLLKV